MRTGGALPMVLLSIGIVTALSVGGSFVARQYGSDTRVADVAAAVDAAAEEVLVRAAAALDTAILGLPVGSTAELATQTSVATVEAVTFVWITRLSGTTYMLASSAQSQRKPLIYSRLRVIVRIDTAGVRPVPYGAWSRLP